MGGYNEDLTKAYNCQTHGSGTYARKLALALRNLAIYIQFAIQLGSPNEVPRGKPAQPQSAGDV